MNDWSEEECKDGLMRCITPTLRDDFAHRTILTNYYTPFSICFACGRL